MGFIPVGAKSRQEHFFHFLLLLKTHKKFVKITFSSVAEKKEHVPEKYLSMILSDAHRINFFPFPGMDICSRSGVVNFP
jgi:hypothetical protein